MSDARSCCVLEFHISNTLYLADFTTGAAKGSAPALHGTAAGLLVQSLSSSWPRSVGKWDPVVKAVGKRYPIAAVVNGIIKRTASQGPV